MTLKEARSRRSRQIRQSAAFSDAERALGALAELIGRSASVDVVDAVFDKFCVGK